MNLLRKIWDYRWVLRSLPTSIFFNFYYLPINQAIKLPIWLCKPRFGSLKGRIIIETNNIKPGLIRLGENRCMLYPNNGIRFENKGGTIIFKGSCSIGNSSAISIGEKGYIQFGDFFSATTQFRCTSYHHIEFGSRCRLGWDCLVMDSDFHKLKRETGGYTKGFGKICLGSDNWIGTRCIILKNTKTPNYCVVASGTKLCGQYLYDEKVIIGSSENIVVQKEGYWRDIFDDQIEY